MNKRVAKKIDRGPQSIVRVYNGGRERWYWDKYNPTQRAEAGQVYDRHSPMGYTDKLIRYVGTLPTDKACQVLVARWPELRRIVLKETWGKQPTPHEDLAFATAVSGPEELQRLREEQNSPAPAEMGDGWPLTLQGFVVDTLSYFSDRWCWSRVGRMDVFMAALAQEMAS